MDEEKTKTRYYRSLELLHPAFEIADRAFVLDSSNSSRNLVLEKKNNELVFHSRKIPEWINKFLLDKLQYKGA